MPTGSSRDVAADMERIFAPLAGRARPARDRVAPVLAGATAAPRRGRSKAVMAVVAPLGALAAVAIGWDLGTVPQVRTPQPDPASPRATRPAEPSPPVAQLAIAQPAPEPVPSVEPVPDAPPPPAELAEVRQRVAARPERRVAPSRAEAGENERCTDDECLYNDVLAADRRLRRAYDRAARAGVSSDWLAGVNRRWVRARDRAQDDPDGAIDRYERLADALDAERRELSQ